MNIQEEAGAIASEIGVQDGPFGAETGKPNSDEILRQGSERRTQTRSTRRGLKNTSKYQDGGQHSAGALALSEAIHTEVFGRKADCLRQSFQTLIAERISPDNLTDLLNRMGSGNELFLLEWCGVVGTVSDRGR